MSNYSNSLSKLTFNFSKDFWLCPSHFTTLTSSIRGINFLIVSSQTLFPSQPPPISPPCFTLILWGFYLVVTHFFYSSSLYFFHVLRTTLVMLSTFTSTTVTRGICGVVERLTKLTPLSPNTCINGVGYWTVAIGGIMSCCGWNQFNCSWHYHWGQRTTSSGPREPSTFGGI